MAGAEQRLLLARQGAAATEDQSMQKVRGLFIASVLPCGGGGADAAELSMRKPTHLNPQQFPWGTIRIPAVEDPEVWLCLYRRRRSSASIPILDCIVCNYTMESIACWPSTS
jgi:hypothetical protein